MGLSRRHEFGHCRRSGWMALVMLLLPDLHESFCCNALFFSLQFEWLLQLCPREQTKVPKQKHWLLKGRISSPSQTIMFGAALLLLLLLFELSSSNVVWFNNSKAKTLKKQIIHLLPSLLYRRFFWLQLLRSSLLQTVLAQIMSLGYFKRANQLSLKAHICWDKAKEYCYKMYRCLYHQVVCSWSI